MVGISSFAAYIPPCPIESLRDSARLGLIHTLGGSIWEGLPVFLLPGMNPAEGF